MRGDLKYIIRDGNGTRLVKPHELSPKDRAAIDFAQSLVQIPANDFVGAVVLFRYRSFWLLWGAVRGPSWGWN